MPSVSDSVSGASAVQTAEEALIEASRALTLHLDLDHVCQAILGAAKAIFDARSSWVLLHEPVTKMLRTAPRALDQLSTYSWPGNIRELQNVIERAIILSSGNTLEADVLSLQRKRSLRPADSDRSVTSFADAERRAIRAALEAAQGPIKRLDLDRVASPD